MSSAAHEKANREYCLSRGLCYRCRGRNYAEPGKTMCAECLDKQKMMMRERKARLLTLGMCTSCGKNPAPEGYTTCEKCRQRRKERYVESGEQQRRMWEHNARLREGKCTICGERYPEIGFVMCARCRRRSNSYRNAEYQKVVKENLREQRKAQGLCVECGKPLAATSTRYCKKHLELGRDRSTIRRIFQRMDREAEEARKRNGNKDTVRA